MPAPNTQAHPTPTHTEEEIRERIRELYSTAPEIHMDVWQSRPKLRLQAAEAIIIGVYPHLFLIEERGTPYPKRRGIPYADVLTGHIRIRELEAAAGTPTSSESP